MPRGVVSVINSTKGSVVKFTDTDFDGDEFENITYDDIDFDAGEFVPAGFDDAASDDNATSRGVLNTSGMKKVKQAESHDAGTERNEARKKEKPTKAKTVTVRSGDTLSAIAHRNGTTVERLCRANGISRNATLSIGQRLKIK